MGGVFGVFGPLAVHEGAEGDDLEPLHLRTRDEVGIKLLGVYPLSIRLDSMTKSQLRAYMEKWYSYFEWVPDTAPFWMTVIGALSALVWVVLFFLIEGGINQRNQRESNLEIAALQKENNELHARFAEQDRIGSLPADIAIEFGPLEKQDNSATVGVCVRNNNGAPLMYEAYLFPNNFSQSYPSSQERWCFSSRPEVFRQNGELFELRIEAKTATFRSLEDTPDRHHHRRLLIRYVAENEVFEVVHAETLEFQGIFTDPEYMEKFK